MDIKARAPQAPIHPGNLDVVLCWWRVPASDGSTIAYVPDEESAEVVARAFGWEGRPFYDHHLDTSYLRGDDGKASR